MSARSRRVEIITVRAAGRAFGIATDDVEAILPHRAAAPAPGSAPFVEGVVAYRGGALPVVDLSARFGARPGPNRPAAKASRAGRRTLVVRIAGGLAGLTVDEVVGSRAARGDGVVEPPSAAGRGAVRGCLVGSDEALVVLDPRAILETEEPIDLPRPPVAGPPGGDAPAVAPGPPRVAGARRRPGRLVAVGVALLAAGGGWLLASRATQVRSAGTVAARPAPAETPIARAIGAPVADTDDPSPAAGTPAAPGLLTLEEVGATPDGLPGAGTPETARYTVVAGDTLWTIARRFTRNPFRYLEIASENDVKDPAVIFPGQALTLRIRRAPPGPTAP